MPFFQSHHHTANFPLSALFARDAHFIFTLRILLSYAGSRTSSRRFILRSQTIKDHLVDKRLQVPSLYPEFTRVGSKEGFDALTWYEGDRDYSWRSLPKGHALLLSLRPRTKPLSVTLLLKQ